MLLEIIISFYNFHIINVLYLFIYISVYTIFINMTYINNVYNNILLLEIIRNIYIC